MFSVISAKLVIFRIHHGTRVGHKNDDSHIDELVCRALPHISPHLAHIHIGLNP